MKDFITEEGMARIVYAALVAAGFVLASAAGVIWNE